MKQCFNPIYYILLFIVFSCNNNDISPIEEPKEAQLLQYIDSMLAEVGLTSYNEVLSGKLNGNFEVFAHYGPYIASCSNPFKVNTELNGSIATDSTRTVPVNGGNLYINDLIVEPNNILRYEIHNNTSEYNNQQQQINLIYGKVNNIRLVKENNIIFDNSVYIPQNIVMKGYDCNTLKMMNDPIEATNAIQWNADYKNLNGVVIEFNGYDINNVERKYYKLVPDNGKYSIMAEDLASFPKDKNNLGVKITLARGNLFFLRGTDNRTYNFTVTTYCGYPFNIK